jgi:hypothetical protein
VCFDFLYNFLLQHFSFQEALSKICSKMYSGLHIKYPSFLSDSNEACKVPDRFSKNAEISNFVKIRAVGAELLHAGGRAGAHDEDNNRFYQFCECA